MPSKPTLLNRIEALHDSDAVSSEKYEELRRVYRKLREHVLEVLSIIGITPDWFYGDQRVHLECFILRHDWKQAHFDLDYLPMGENIKERCERCGRRKVSSTDAHGYFMNRNDFDRAGYNLPYMGRALTKRERTVLTNYLQLLQAVEELEAKQVRKTARKAGSRRLRSVSAAG